MAVWMKKEETCFTNPFIKKIDKKSLTPQIAVFLQRDCQLLHQKLVKNLSNENINTGVSVVFKTKS